MTSEEHALLDYPTAGFKNFSGGGGLTSTASDYLRFIQTLLNEGEYGDFELLSRKSIEVITSDQMIRLNEDGKGLSNKPGITYGLGFALYEDGSEGINYKSPGTYEWGGYFNTKFFIDPKEELVFVGMTQMLPFLMENSGSASTMLFMHPWIEFVKRSWVDLSSLSDVINLSTNLLLA